MRIEGRWHLFGDGSLRPVVEAKGRTRAGTWVEVLFLLDSGADRTGFTSDYEPMLAPFRIPGEEAPQLSGIGGEANAFFTQTAITFTRDDGGPVLVSGPFGVFTDPASSDVPILGRDVSDNLAVIYDYPQRRVELLAPPHGYEIRRA